MKKASLIFVIVMIATICYGQNSQNYKWELTDSISKTKNQIYSDTKLFIAETWNSSRDVIQMDDKENGLILLKGVSGITITYNLGVITTTYYFAYTVKFLMKDNKYRITLDNVNCNDVTTTCTTNVPPLSLDGYRGLKDNISKANYNKVMDDLKSNLSNIVSSYQGYINKPTVIDTF